MLEQDDIVSVAVTTKVITMDFSYSRAGRSSKRQMGGFLTPDLHRIIEIKLVAANLTHQESVANAVNRYLTGLGSPALLPSGHRRLIHRGTQRAAVRATSNSPSRRKRIYIGGWYPADTVSEVVAILGQAGTSVQHAVEFGLMALYGPQEADDAQDADDTEPAAAPALDGSDAASLALSRAIDEGCLEGAQELFASDIDALWNLHPEHDNEMTAPA